MDNMNVDLGQIKIMDKDNIEGVGIMWRRDGGQYHLPTLDRRQEDQDREKMIIINSRQEVNKN